MGARQSRWGSGEVAVGSPSPAGRSAGDLSQRGVGNFWRGSWLCTGMLPREPEDWPGVFERYVVAGNLDAVLELYDPEARFITPTGETIFGPHRIREMVAGLIRTTKRMKSRVRKVVKVGDVAILYTDFERTELDARGVPVEIHDRAIEVLRRQADGGWRLIVGDPNGRARR